MLGTDFINAPKRSMHELSYSRETDVYVLAEVGIGALKIIDFEGLMEQWYGPSRKNANRLCRCDGVYYSAFEECGGFSLCLVEFKTGKVEQLNLHRKLYDSLIGLVENAGLTFAEARQNVDYVVVKGVEEPTSPREQVAERKSELLNRPWKSETYKCEYNLYKQEGVLAHKAYCLTPSQFKTFVEETWVLARCVG